MEEELIDAVPCSSLAVDAILRIGTAGAIWGLCAGPQLARKRVDSGIQLCVLILAVCFVCFPNTGLSGITRASFVAKSIGKYGFQCGLVAGVFSSTRCGIQRYRKQNDWVNALIAGAVTGAAIAAGTRRWTQVIGVAGIVSAFSAAADYSGTN